MLTTTVSFRVWCLRDEFAIDVLVAVLSWSWIKLLSWVVRIWIACPGILPWLETGFVGLVLQILLGIGVLWQFINTVSGGVHRKLWRRRVVWFGFQDSQPWPVACSIPGRRSIGSLLCAPSTLSKATKLQGGSLCLLVDLFVWPLPGQLGPLAFELPLCLLRKEMHQGRLPLLHHQWIKYLTLYRFVDSHSMHSNLAYLFLKWNWMFVVLGIHFPGSIEIPWISMSIFNKWQQCLVECFILIVTECIFLLFFFIDDIKPIFEHIRLLSILGFDWVSLQCLPGAQMGHSIQGSDVKLLYGEYMDHFWAKLRGNVPGLRIMDLLPEYQVQEASKARVHNWLLCGDRVRRVRFTYFDGGAAGQAFNSLLYPDPRFVAYYLCSSTVMFTFLGLGLGWGWCLQHSKNFVHVVYYLDCHFWKLLCTKTENDCNFKSECNNVLSCRIG